MVSPLLRTKLHIPLPRPNLVVRPRLIRLLEGGLRAKHKLTLVSASAGFGKTTLLTGWLHSKRNPASPIQARLVKIAWLSLDARDGQDASRFWTYVLSSLHSASPSIGAPSIGDIALSMLQATPPAVEETPRV